MPRPREYKICRLDPHWLFYAEWKSSEKLLLKNLQKNLKSPDSEADPTTYKHHIVVLINEIFAVCFADFHH